jgi:hypothetical protein
MTPTHPSRSALSHPSRFHVDHVIPLRHPLVCGLHAHTNLRVVPALVNLKKGNRMLAIHPDSV